MGKKSKQFCLCTFCLPVCLLGPHTVRTFAGKHSIKAALNGCNSANGNVFMRINEGNTAERLSKHRGNGDCYGDT